MRDYTPGDDLRQLDWNIYARLEKPFIKLLEEEEDLAVHILLDGSLSMNWGTDEEVKFNYTRRLAARAWIHCAFLRRFAHSWIFAGRAGHGRIRPHARRSRDAATLSIS